MNSTLKIEPWGRVASTVAGLQDSRSRCHLPRKKGGKKTTANEAVPIAA